MPYIIKEISREWELLISLNIGNNPDCQHNWIYNNTEIHHANDWDKNIGLPENYVLGMSDPSQFIVKKRICSLCGQKEWAQEVVKEIAEWIEEESEFEKIEKQFEKG